MVNKKNSGISLVTFIVIILLFFVLFLGKLDVTVASGDEGVQVNQLTLLTRGNNIDYYINLGKDFMTFIRDFKKFNLFSVDKTIKQQVVPEIERYEKKLKQLKAEEQQLNQLISSIPTEEYNHNKIELSSFIIEELKKKGLIYEIDYNYSPETSDSKDKKNGEDVPQNLYTNQIMIKIEQIDKGGTYSKVLEVMDEIFIKEPYEIKSLSIEFDEEILSYYLMIVIEV